jgi:2-polyprenyl-3-methyl-5-hydroxy-6-metoxy-1,4-benzoquinol methylase
MENATRDALLEINRRFYATRSREFSQTRRGAWPGFDGLLPYVEEGARVLDLGCGNGRLAEYLGGRRQQVSYEGIDFSPELLSIATETAARLELAGAHFRHGDLSSEEWTEGLPEASFDVVAAIAVLQHVPGVDARQRLLEQAAALAKDRGVIALTSWQFMKSERLRVKVANWSLAGIDPSLVDPGDYLLEWRGGGLTHRYCRMVDLEEVSSLASGAGMYISESYISDGHGGDQNLYTILRRR